MEMVFRGIDSIKLENPENKTTLWIKNISFLVGSAIFLLDYGVCYLEEGRVACESIARPISIPNKYNLLKDFLLKQSPALADQGISISRSGDSKSELEAIIEFEFV